MALFNSDCPSQIHAISFGWDSSYSRTAYYQKNCNALFLLAWLSVILMLIKHQIEPHVCCATARRLSGRMLLGPKPTQRLKEIVAEMVAEKTTD